MKRHEAMPPRYCYEQPVARHRLHAMVTSALERFFALPVGGGAPSSASVHRFDAAVVFTRRLHRLRQLSRFAECAMAQTAVAAAEDSAFEAAAIATIITTIASPSYLSPAAAAATEAPCARHRCHATVSSASLRSPWGRAPSGAWVHAGSMPPAHVLCRLRAMDAHKQQHGSGSGRRTLTPMIESVAARGGRENYSFDCGGDCLSHHVVLMPPHGARA